MLRVSVVLGVLAVACGGDSRSSADAAAGGQMVSADAAAGSQMVSADAAWARQPPATEVPVESTATAVGASDPAFEQAGTEPGNDALSASASGGLSDGEPQPAADGPADSESGTPADIEPALPQDADRNDHPLPALDGNFEFIAWGELADVGTGGELASSLSIRSVSRATNYDGEHVLLAIETDTGSNRIVAINANERTIRDHWPLECGDCIASADYQTSVIADGAKLYAALDHGFRYFDVAQVEFGSDPTVTSVHVSGHTIVAHGAWGWATMPDEPSAELSLLAWPDTVASVNGASALAVTSESVTYYAEDGTETTLPNPCPVPLSSYPLGMARHDLGEYGEFDIACDGGQLARTDDFPNTPFEIIDLDSAIAWVGELYIATQHSWYDDLSLDRFGYQGELDPMERVLGYVDHPRVGIRVSNLGLAFSILTVPVAE